jgi:hypothetical protein
MKDVRSSEGATDVPRKRSEVYEKILTIITRILFPYTNTMLFNIFHPAVYKLPAATFIPNTEKYAYPDKEEP